MTLKKGGTIFLADRVTTRLSGNWFMNLPRISPDRENKPRPGYAFSGPGPFLGKSPSPTSRFQALNRQNRMKQA